MTRIVRTIGGYEIVKRLAVGGMAELFLGQKSGIEGFRKQVVLKRILPELLGSQDFVRMFLDEARLAAQLDHPNIVHVHDFGRDGDSYFFVMEHVRGRDLRAMVKAAAAFGGVPLEHALSIVLGVAAGLHHAHERLDGDGRSLKIVHRDVSPGNVLVSFDGDVKLVDFGIAKARQRQTQTKVGALKGKVGYMSPEQVRGEPLDRRSDIFSLGILLYELTTGGRLFDTSGGELQLLHMVASADVTPPSERTSNYPAALERIVLRALARDRDARYATAEALQCDLERFAHDAGLMISPVRLRVFMRMLFPDDVPARRPTEPVWDEPDMARAATVLDTALLPPEEPAEEAHRSRATTAAIRRKAPDVMAETAPQPVLDAPTLARGTQPDVGGARRRRRGMGAVAVGVAAGVVAAITAVMVMNVRDGEPTPAAAAAAVTPAPVPAPVPVPAPAPPPAPPVVEAAPPPPTPGAVIFGLDVASAAFVAVEPPAPVPVPAPVPPEHHHRRAVPAPAAEEATEPAATPGEPPAAPEAPKLEL